MAADQNRTSSQPGCRVIRPQLGGDPGTPNPAVAAHLARCAACRAEASRLHAAWTLLNVVEQPNPSPQFSRRVWEKIRAESSSLPAPRWGGGLPGWSWRWTAAGLAVALAAVVPVVVWYEDRHERPELVAQVDLVESREMLTDLEVVEQLDVLLLLDDP